jgi:hypothetical protein
MARPPNHLQDLFSRGSSPPQNQVQHQPFNSPSNPPQSGPPNQIDSLFQNLNPNNTPSQPPTMGGGNPFRNPEPPVQNAPTTDDSFSTSGSPQNNATAERERAALLSLLGPAVSPPGALAGTAPAPAPGPQQMPTPPGSSQRSGSSPNDGNNEMQGKALLDQIMSG